MTERMVVTYPDGTVLFRDYVSGRGLKYWSWGGHPTRIEVIGDLVGKQRSICLSHTPEVYVNGEKIHD